MSKVIRNIATQRPVWTSQPQGAVGVDWIQRKPLVFLMPSGNSFDSLRFGVPFSPASCSTVLTKYGWAIANPTNLSADPQFMISGGAWGPGCAVMTSVVCTPGNFRTTACALLTSTNNYFQLGFISESNRTLHVRVSNGTYTSTGYVLPSDGSMVTLVLYMDNGDIRLFANGALVSQLGLSCDWWYDGIAVGHIFGQWSEISPIRTLAVGNWSRITPSYAQSLSANPYQIFQPPARQVPFDLVRGPAEPRQSYMMGTTAPEVSTAMPAAILKTPCTSQPQGVTPALRNGVKASSIFVPNASLYGALHSTHFIGAGAGGRELVMPYFSTPRASAGHGNVSFSAEWTIVCVYRRNAEGIGWGRAFSAGSESATSAVFGLAYGSAGGSFGQLYIVVSGSNASSVSSYSPTDTDPIGVVNVQVFTCKGGVVTSWKNGGLKVAGVAANIGSVNAGQMYLGSQVGAQSGGFNILGLITLPYGLSDRDGRDLSANPWQIFAPQSKQIWVTT